MAYGLTVSSCDPLTKIFLEAVCQMVYIIQGLFFVFASIKLQVKKCIILVLILLLYLSLFSSL